MEGIKMVSGQQPGPMQQGQYPMYQPMYQPPHRSTGDMMKTMFLSNLMIGMAVALGLVLMWVGALIWGFTTDHDVANIGMAIKSFGMLALVGALLLGGLARQDLDRWVRVIMIFSAALLLIFIGFWSGMWSALGINIPIGV